MSPWSAGKALAPALSVSGADIDSVTAASTPPASTTRPTKTPRIPQIPVGVQPFPAGIAATCAISALSPYGRVAKGTLWDPCGQPVATTSMSDSDAATRLPTQAQRSKHPKLRALLISKPFWPGSRSPRVPEPLAGSPDARPPASSAAGQSRHLRSAGELAAPPAVFARGSFQERGCDSSHGSSALPPKRSPTSQRG